MVKHLSFKEILIGCMLLIPIGAFAAETGGKMTVAVMDFKNTSSYDGEWMLGQGMADMLNTDLFKTGKFRVVEREKLNLIMQEKQLARDGEVNSKQAAALGKLIGADYIITGNVTEFGLSQGGFSGAGSSLGGGGRRGGGLGGFGGLGVKTQTARVVVDVRVVNAKTGELVAADEGEGKESTGSLTAGGGNWRDFGGISFGSAGFDSSLPGKATRKAINVLVERISNALYLPKVIDVTGKEVTINVGSASGIKKDMRMKVLGQGKDIKDPDSGEVIHKKGGTIGTIKIIDVQDKYSTGVIIDGEGSIEAGNQVEKQ
jgi:curli biogenesis system outer membrane secretion channel CsgG